MPFPSLTVRPSDDTIPSVTLERRPSGFPIASAKSPTSSFAESANVAGRGVVPLTLTTARSLAGKLPTSVPSYVPFASVILNVLKFPTTCAFVMMLPLPS
jgi:hypothetical protein